MIALTYINKNSATIAAMKDYENMKHIIANTSSEVKEEYDGIMSVNSPSFDDMPKAYNPKAGENKVIHSLDRINVMLERYKQAQEYMQWFEPAWLSLNVEERVILKEFYMQGSQRSGATARLQVKMNYSERYIDKLRGISLGKLTKMLYGI